MAGTRLERWSPLSGVVFVVAYVIAGVVFDDQPAPGASDRAIVTYYADGGNQLKLEAASLAIILATPFFLWFGGVLSARIRRATGTEWLSRIALVSAGAFASVTAIGMAIAVFVPDAVDDDPDVFRLDPDVARLLTNGAYTVTFEAAVPLAAPLVLAASVASLRSAFLPRWLAWAGFAVTVACLLGFLGGVAFLLAWIVAVGVALMRAGGEPRPVSA